MSTTEEKIMKLDQALCKKINDLNKRIDNAYARIAGINHNMMNLMKAMELSAQAGLQMNRNLALIAERIGFDISEVHLDLGDPGPDVDSFECQECLAGNFNLIPAQPERSDEPGHDSYYECDSCGFIPEGDPDSDREASLADDKIKAEKENRQ